MSWIDRVATRARYNYKFQIYVCSPLLFISESSFSEV